MRTGVWLILAAIVLGIAEIVATRFLPDLARPRPRR